MVATLRYTAGLSVRWAMRIVWRNASCLWRSPAGIVPAHCWKANRTSLANQGCLLPSDFCQAPQRLTQFSAASYFVATPLPHTSVHKRITCVPCRSWWSQTLEVRFVTACCTLVSTKSATQTAAVRLLGFSSEYLSCCCWHSISFSVIMRTAGLAWLSFDGSPLPVGSSLCFDGLTGLFALRKALSCHLTWVDFCHAPPYMEP